MLRRSSRSNSSELTFDDVILSVFHFGMVFVENCYEGFLP
jgi:hypothetical protein